MRMKKQIDRSLQDRAYDLLGEMILEQEAATLLQEIEEEQNADSATAMEAYFQERDALFLKLIDKKLRKHRTTQHISSLALKALKSAAVFALVILTVGSIALAASEPLRIEALRLLVKHTENYTLLELAPSAGSMNVPAQWRGGYFITDVPEDLEVVQCTRNTVQFISRTNPAQYVVFGEYDTDASVNIDTEDSVFQQTVVLGLPAQLASKDGLIHIFWVMDDRLFTITFCGYNANEAVQLANQTKKIK